VTPDLKLGVHLDQIRGKVSYVTHRLTPIRLIGNTKLNLNLFKVFILPLYRLAFNNYGTADTKEQVTFEKDVRRSYKKFMTWPINTSDAVVNSTLGDPRTIALESLARIRRMTNRRLGNTPLSGSNQVISSSSRTPSRFPVFFTKLIQLQYSTKCVEHNVINNNSHMT
jgi:hypothetical protein